MVANPRFATKGGELTYDHCRDAPLLLMANAPICYMWPYRVAQRQLMMLFILAIDSTIAALSGGP